MCKIESESCCCTDIRGSQQGCRRKVPKSWNREQKIQYYHHRIECSQERIQEAQQGLEEIEKDERS